ncbi:hypothetical protein EZI54_15235 [Marinobacter halodurans]|uniref:DUF975 family protein n=1 Tax=Marinobacter halodurans TaxID=2528979 RepID=A0ABY1ZM13_9GAMM|nr:hypothetical protein [Marinobacter halodurans]TBW53334.1 hypothetical protein EZI54_15235 [Marinobacter halodurans]
MNTQSEAFSDTSTSVEVRKIKAGPPLSWVVDSFRLIRRHWKTILLAYLIVTVASVLIQVGIASLGAQRPGFGLFVLVLVGVFVAIVLQAGMAAVFHGAAEKQPRIQDVFRGFRGRSVLSMILLLVAMILVALAFGLVTYLLVRLFGAGDAMSGLFSPRESYGYTMGALMGGSSLVLGFVLLGTAVVMALFCYAMPLIIIADEGVISAMSNSFRASFKNLFVLCIFGMNMAAIYFLVMIVPMIGGALSTSLIVFGVVMGLASWLFGLVINGAYYLSFRDVLLPASAQQAATAE